MRRYIYIYHSRGVVGSLGIGSDFIRRVSAHNKPFLSAIPFVAFSRTIYSDWAHSDGTNEDHGLPHSHHPISLPAIPPAAGLALLVVATSAFDSTRLYICGFLDERDENGGGHGGYIDGVHQRVASHEIRTWVLQAKGVLLPERRRPFSASCGFDERSEIVYTHS